MYTEYLGGFSFILSVEQDIPPLIEYPYLSMSKESYFFFSVADIERQQTLLRNLDIKLAFGRVKKHHIKAI